jgi:putative NADH-flavin reductase
MVTVGFLIRYEAKPGNEEGRLAHYNADIAQLEKKASDLVEHSLVIQKVDVLAAKLPG